MPLNDLNRGEDIDHYGRLTVAMVGHHFLDMRKLADFLLKGTGADEFLTGIAP